MLHHKLINMQSKFYKSHEFQNGFNGPTKQDHTKHRSSKLNRPKLGLFTLQ